MSSSILDQLEAKPVPKKQQQIRILIPKKGQVAIKAAIVDLRSEGYNRQELKNKLRNKGMLIGLSGDKSAAHPATARPKAGPTAGPTGAPKTRPAKIKKLKKRMRIAKKPTGTITALTKPATGPIKIKKRSRKLPDVDEEDITFVLEDLPARLPKEIAPLRIKANAYYMNNREIFINFINSLFDSYRDAILDESQDISCDSKRGAFSLLTHQEIVRDYINFYTPYRGLLLYHGLGAGKTCASIAIAEGLKHHNQIIILTPASLRQNYINELKTCGDPLYRLNQYWEFIPTKGDPQIAHALATTLSLPLHAVTSKGGAWLVDVRRPSNFDTLDTAQRQQLNEQIHAMIQAKYRFINYNGLRDSHLSGFSNNGRINPFDNKVVIVDEAHNFVSRIVNKLKKPDSLSMKLYEFLLNAQNCRVVFLTGTPIINYPNEIGVLFNMLRGYIKTFKFTVDIQTSDRIDQAAIEELFSKFKVTDYVQYNSSSKTIVITRNPFTFASQFNDKAYMGVRKNRGGNTCDSNRACQIGFTCDTKKKVCVPLTDDDFVKIITGILRKKQIRVVNFTAEPFKALPDTLDGFKDLFIDVKTGEIKNENLLQRRIVGLTSYFRSAREELMPAFDIDKDLVVEEIPMSDYQFAVYEAARSKERSQEKRAALKGARAKKAGELYADSTSTYRIFSRAFCNFVFPNEIGRPMPREEQDMGEALKAGDEDLLDVVSLDEKLANVDGKYELDDADALKLQQQQNVDSTYEARIQRALQDLETNAETYLSLKGLETYSPKFLEMFKNIVSDDNKGSHLVYSQFRTLEGIGIFTLVLKQNGFIHFKLKKSGAGGWELDIADDDIGKPAFALYTGTEDTEEKEILRKIFNGDWDNIPSNIAEQLRLKGDDNNMGDIIKVLMITSSGAEGITLKNTRFVHIVEPYWHPVRMEQVIGRARRICSHKDLPEELRTVKVFLYLMAFSKAQLVPASTGGMASKELLMHDTSKLNRKLPYTSDQALFEISTIKEDINKQILRSVKASAIDCALHSRADDKDNIVCLSFGAVAPKNFTTTPALTVERDFDKQQQQNLRKITWKAIVIKLGGKRYAFKQDFPGGKGKQKKIGEVYDLDSYLRARKHGGNPILKGYLRPDPETGKIGFEEI